MKRRSQNWFANPDNREMTALYLERYLNYGLTREELQSGRPIIGIAQTGSDLAPCNRHHIELTKRVRDGITAAGGTVMEIPVHPIQETGKRPTAMLDRNLAYLSLVESLYGYPIDGVVLNIGCDKTTPALLMAAATVNIPAIAFSVGPMLNGWFRGVRTGSGTIIWKAREMHAAGEIDDEGFMDLVASSTPSVGYCNTMGTATTMNSLAEALGMQLPGSAAIPAPYRERGQMAYRTGQRIVEMVDANLRPSDIMTRSAFENAIAVCSAIGGSTNAPIHLNAIARHLGVPLDNDDWQRIGHRLPLLVNLQPAGEYLGEDYHHAGGVPAVVGELIAAGLLPNPDALTANGHTLGENCESTRSQNTEVIKTVDAPMLRDAGFLNLKGNLFDSALMKTSVISPRIPRPLPRQCGRPRGVRGHGGGVRRARGFPRPDRRPLARPRRGHHPGDARRRTDRLPGRRRGGEHAAPRLPHQAGHPRAALHRRRAAVGHLRLALDPQRLARGGRWRRPRRAADRRPHPRRPPRRHRQRAGGRRRTRPPPVRARPRTPSPPRARPRGRRSSASVSGRSPRA